MASLRPLRTTSVLRTLPHSIKPSPYLCRPLTTTPNLHHNTTVDPSEVTHFNALASTWWDPHGSSRLLHLMNPLRHTFISRCHSSQPDAPPPNRTLSYLDVGCGGGIFAESAARLKNTASVTAIDPSPEVLSVAVAHAKRDPGLVSMMGEGRLEYRNTSIEELPRPGTEGGRQYDVVTLFEVLEHVTHPAPFLEHLLPFVKPGGWLVLSTIARTWTSWLTTKVVAEEVVGIVPRGTHDWNKYINEGELREWFAKKEGWGNIRAMGVVYVPGLGWREVPGSEGLGNYFFGVRKEGDGVRA
ncbi:Hexaprenyldihydroxybenzoate methyltransferase, mitochondrial [Coniosporium apollinis]|uniref:Ubiquinone biosynthesis O-methyltransferase, mitochondrial n=1 Tax=Coniosporium apollinis TaxID=61459 RepID=A0ABQ9NZ95_9PEZI|nr:Hexaprenyldihydroxybenzoate methyltransferase, mitochondrial [Coniosporium apollinis]